MTEKALQSQIIDLLRKCGWLVAHFRSVPVKRGERIVWETPVQADGAGYPDIIAIHLGRGRQLAIELKVGRNRPSAKQELWLAAFRAVGVPTFVWTEKTDLDEIRRAITEDVK